MELIEFVRGRWLAAVLAAPVVAGALTVGVVASSVGSTWEASATVPVTLAIIGSESSGQSVGPVVDDFTALLSGDFVASSVADAIDVEAGSVPDSFSTWRAGTGGDVEVSFAAGSEAAAEEGLDVGVRSALTAIAEGERRRVSLQLTAAEQQVETSRARLGEIESAAGVPDILNEYRQYTTNVQVLRNEVASGTPGLQGLVDTMEQERRALGALLTDWELARAQLDQASSARDDAERRLLLAEAVVVEMEDGRVLRASSVYQASSLPDVALPTVAAMAVALGIVLVSAVLWRRRQVDDERAVAAAGRDRVFGGGSGGAGGAFDGGDLSYRGEAYDGGEVYNGGDAYNGGEVYNGGDPSHGADVFGGGPDPVSDADLDPDRTGEVPAQTSTNGTPADDQPAEGSDRSASRLWRQRPTVTPRETPREGSTRGRF